MVDIVYFSWTGSTEKVAKIIANELSKYCNVRLIRIRPRREHSYIVWLLLSFTPLDVEINHIDEISETFCLCMPKWTLNCPPVTYFIKNYDLTGKKVFLEITYGGFDEKRYAKAYKKMIEKRGAKVLDILLVRRRYILSSDAKKDVINWAHKIARSII